MQVVFKEGFTVIQVPTKNQYLYIVFLQSLVYIIIKLCQ